MNENPIRKSELIAMIETNVRSMTDEFLAASLVNARQMAAEAKANDDTWRRIADIYAAELARRQAV